MKHKVRPTLLLLVIGLAFIVMGFAGVATPLPMQIITSPLHTEGRYIKDSLGNTVILRGVTAGSFAFVDGTAGHFVPIGANSYALRQGWNPNAVQQQIEEASAYGANFIRATINYYDWKANTEMPVLGGGTIAFREALRTMLTIAAQHGIYVCYVGYLVVPGSTWIDGAFFETGVGGHDWCPWPPYQSGSSASPLATGPYGISNVGEWVQFWSDFMWEYRDHVNLIVEPHNEMTHCPTSEYFNGVQNIINERDRLGLATILVPHWAYGPDGHNWGYIGQHRYLDWYTDYPLSGDNLLYSLHTYTNGMMWREPGYPDPPAIGPTDIVSVRRRFTNYSDQGHPEWGHHMLQYLKDGYPLIVGETGIGSTTAEDYILMQNFMKVMDELGVSAAMWWWRNTGVHAMWTGPFSSPPILTTFGSLMQPYMVPTTPSEPPVEPPPDNGTENGDENTTLPFTPPTIPTLPEQIPEEIRSVNLVFLAIGVGLVAVSIWKKGKWGKAE